MNYEATWEQHLARFREADSLYRAGDMRSAKRVFFKALALSPGDVDTLWAWVRALASLVSLTLQNATSDVLGPAPHGGERGIFCTTLQTRFLTKAVFRLHCGCTSVCRAPPKRFYWHGGMPLLCGASLSTRPLSPVGVTAVKPNVCISSADVLAAQCGEHRRPLGGFGRLRGLQGQSGLPRSAGKTERGSHISAAINLTGALP